MSNLQSARQRIVATQNTAKITNAMQMVSAVKFRKYQQLLSNSGKYLEKLKESIAEAVATIPSEDLPELIKSNSSNSNKALIVTIGLNRGLVGPLQSKIERAFIELYEELTTSGMEVDIVTVKRKTAEIPAKFGLKVKNSFDALFEQLDSLDITVLKSILVDDFKNGIYSKVYVVHPYFISSMVQDATSTLFIPFGKESFQLNTRNDSSVIKFEPTTTEVLNILLDSYIEGSIQYFLLQAVACEYGARVVAMKQASDNAKDIEVQLKQSYFKTRQKIITQQLQESTRKK